MKNLGLNIAVVGAFMIAGCGASTEVTPVGGTVIPDQKITIPQADALMQATVPTVVITDANCSSGNCIAKATFTNLGGKTAGAFTGNFSITSDAVSFAMTSWDAQSADPSQNVDVNAQFGYSGASLPAGKVGSIVLNYTSNAGGTQVQASVDVIKQ